MLVPILITCLKCFSYPTNGLKKELREQLMWLAEKFSSANERMNKTDSNHGCSKFTPNLEKKQVWEQIYHEMDIPVVCILGYSYVFRWNTLVNMLVR